MYLQAKIDDKNFSEFAQSLYKNRQLTRIPPNLQKPVYASILRSATAETLEEFAQMYIECKTPEEKEKIALLLAEVTREDLIQKVLEFAFSVHFVGFFIVGAILSIKIFLKLYKSIVTLEESVYIIVSLAKNSTNEHSSRLTWLFIKNNWSSFYERFSDSLLIGRLLKVNLICLVN